MGTANQSFSHVTSVEGNGVRIKTPPILVARAATTANISDLAAASVSQDGVTCVAGDILLVKNQSTAAQNGYYAFGDVGGGLATLTRVWPLESGVEAFSGTTFHVESGTTNGGKQFVLTNAGVATVGTTSLTFATVVDSGSVANTTAQMNITLAGFVDADGDPLAKFVDGASTVPGFNLADSEAFGIRWNNHATPDPILTQVTMPQDLDDTAAIVIHFLASKTGATVGDAVTFVCTAFFHTVGALHDADTNAGGTSGAMTGDATAKTVQELTLSIAAGDVPASPSSLSLTVQPTDGTLGTDDVIVEAVWIEYTRRVTN